MSVDEHMDREVCLNRRQHAARAPARGEAAMRAANGTGEYDTSSHGDTQRSSFKELRPLLRHVDELSTPGRDRTCDLWFRKPSLYPLSYGGEETSHMMSIRPRLPGGVPPTHAAGRCGLAGR